MNLSNFPHSTFFAGGKSAWDYHRSLTYLIANTDGDMDMIELGDPNHITSEEINVVSKHTKLRLTFNRDQTHFTLFKIGPAGWSTEIATYENAEDAANAAMEKALNHLHEYTAKRGPLVDNVELDWYQCAVDQYE